MTHFGRFVLILASGLCAWPLPSHAVIYTSEGPAPADGGNPYHAIVDRNVFGLKPPPAAPDPEANKPPPPKITPTGILTILGKRALFKVQMPARPPEPAKEQSYIMSEGQREGQIEVLEIDEKAGAIKFNNYGTVMTLTLEKDGAKIPNTPPPAVPPPAVPGAPGIPTAFNQPQAPTQPGGSAITTFGGNAGVKSIPTRTLRLPNAPGAGAAAVQPQGTASTPSMEEQIILMEVEREQHKNDAHYPPLPPTPLNPAGGKAPGAPPPVPQ